MSQDGRHVVFCVNPFSLPGKVKVWEVKNGKWDGWVPFSAEKSGDLGIFEASLKEEDLGHVRHASVFCTFLICLRCRSPTLRCFRTGGASYLR